MIQPIETGLLAGLINAPQTWFEVADNFHGDMLQSDLAREVLDYIVAQTMKSSNLKRINIAKMIQAVDPEDDRGVRAVVLDANQYGRDHAKESAARIVEMYKMRQLVDVVANATFALDSAPDYETAYTDLLTQLRSLDQIGSAQIKTFEQIGIGLMDRIHAARKAGRSLGLDTGFASFDESTGGLFDGDLWLISGKPSHGKTLVAQNVLKYLSENGTPCTLLSVEMTAEAILQRYIQIELQGSIHAQKVRRAYNLNDAEVGQIEAVIKKMNALPMRVVDGEGTLQRLIPLMKRDKEENGTKVFCVDYIQLMTDTDAESEYNQVTNISKALKQFAKRENVIVIALSQLSRQGLLRASGQLDQDADIISEIKWAWRDDDSQPEHEREFNTWKARNGEICKIKLKAVGLSYVEFDEFAAVITGADGREQPQIIPPQDMTGNRPIDGDDIPF